MPKGKSTFIHHIHSTYTHTHTNTHTHTLVAAAASHIQVSAVLSASLAEITQLAHVSPLFFVSLFVPSVFCLRAQTDV